MNRIKDDRQPYHYLCFSLCYWCHDVVSAIISTYDDDDDYCEVGPSYICSPTWGGEKLKVRLFHFHFLLHTFLALQFGVRERNFTPSDEFWEKVYFYVRLLYCIWGHGGNFHYLKLECAVAKLNQKSTLIQRLVGGIMWISGNMNALLIPYKKPMKRYNWSDYHYHHNHWKKPSSSTRPPSWAPR